MVAVNEKCHCNHNYFLAVDIKLSKSEKIVVLMLVKILLNPKLHSNMNSMKNIFVVF